jgi:hypothetical protein
MQEFWQGVDTRINAVTKSLIRPYTLAVEDTDQVTVDGNIVDLALVRLPGEEDFAAGDIPWAPVTGAAPSIGDVVLVLVDAYGRRVITGGGGGTTYTIGSGLDLAGSTLSVDPTEFQAPGAFVAGHATAQNDIDDQVFTTVIYDNQIVDTGNWYDPVTGIYTPGLAGAYLLTASLTLSSVVASTRIIVDIYKNDNSATSARLDQKHTSTTAGIGGGGSTIMTSNGTDNFRVKFWHNMGATGPNITASSANTFTGVFLGST